MTRAKTQTGAPKRAATQGGAKKRAPSVPFNELEAAIDALDADDDAPKLPPRPPSGDGVPEARHPLPKPVRRGPPPPPSAGKRPPAALPRAASSAGGLAPARATSRTKTSPPSPQVAAAERSLPKAPSKGPPKPPPAATKLDLGSPMRTGRRLDSDDFADMSAADSSDGRVRRRFDSQDSGGVRAISIGEADDFVVEVEEMPEVRSLALAIFDDPPAIATAKQAIGVAGHKVIAAATGETGIEQIKSLLRSGSADVLLVGVPGGEEVIETALALAPRRPVVVAVSSGTAVEAVRRAASVGADLAIARPVDVDKLAPAMLAASRLGAERAAARGPDTALKGRLDALAEPEPGALQPFDLFQRVLDLELKRSKRYGYPIAVALFSVEIDPPEPPAGMRGILRARAGNALIQSIRDIDLATEVDQERFFVLLPYTTLAGAAQVARRIITTVTSLPPITASGRTIPPRLVGAVAGVVSGQASSFARLIRDATQALEQARRDGAELAVPLVRPPDDESELK